MDIPTNHQFKNLTGQVFGRVTVIEYAGQGGADKRAMWKCRCECGNEFNSLGTRLRYGDTTSCGCQRNESVAKVNWMHGLSKTREHRIWRGMIQRCTNPDNPAWKDYGERGITICKRWMKFTNFLEDMGKCPARLTIERKNNDKGYSKANCKWGTRSEQSNNTRASRKISHAGQIMTVAQWARKLGMTRSALALKLSKGLNIAKILCTRQSNNCNP